MRLCSANEKCLDFELTDVETHLGHHWIKWKALQLKFLVLRKQKKMQQATLLFNFKGNFTKKMTTPSRKLRHTAEASLTVFINEGVVDKNSLFQYFSIFCIDL